jgi:hypothetical protein
METTALVAIVGITVALIEGGIGLIKFLINKIKKDDDTKTQEAILLKLERIAKDTARNSWVQQNWADTQKEIVDRIHVITEMNMKMLVIIERLERRIEKE